MAKNFRGLPDAMSSNPMLKSDGMVLGKKLIQVIGEGANSINEILNFDKRKNPDKTITLPIFFTKSIEFLKANTQNDGKQTNQNCLFIYY
jgi:hypothetical protein